MKFELKPLTKALVLASALVAGGAQASSLDYLAGATGATSGWGATVQTFTSVIDQQLVAYTFAGAASSQGTYKFSVYDWTTNSGALYSTTNSWVGGLNTVAAINLNLQAGHVYAAEVDYLGNTPGGVLYGSDVYAGGSGFWGPTGVGGVMGAYTSFAYLETGFKADFGSTTAVPEESTTLMLMAGLGMLAWVGRRQRRSH